LAGAGGRKIAVDTLTGATRILKRAVSGGADDYMIVADGPHETLVSLSGLVRAVRVADMFDVAPVYESPHEEDWNCLAFRADGCNFLFYFVTSSSGNATPQCVQR
jgi:hypothetical protein